MNDEPGARTVPRIALVTYSTKPRGGVVHCLELAEALYRAGCPVHVFALGDPAAGFFRPTAVPHTIFPAPGRQEPLRTGCGTLSVPCAKGWSR